LTKLTNRPPLNANRTHTLHPQKTRSQESYCGVLALLIFKFLFCFVFLRGAEETETEINTPKQHSKILTKNGIKQFCLFWNMQKSTSVFPTKIILWKNFHVFLQFLIASKLVTH